MNYRNKNWAILLIVLICGIVVGGFIGEYLGNLPYMGFLKYGDTFGLTEPFTLDLSIISITFGLKLKATIAGVIGLIIAGIVYRKI